MKLRLGLVSNSSSTCFILDRRDPRVVSFREGLKVMDPPGGFGRMNAHGEGQEIIDYAEEWLGDDEPYGVGLWILQWAEKIGEENIVFIRDSDEDGYIFISDNNDEWTTLRVLALDEMEYH